MNDPEWLKNTDMSDAMAYFVYSTFKGDESFSGRSGGKSASLEPQFLKPGYTLSYIDGYTQNTSNFWNPIFREIEIEEAQIEQ